MVFWEGAKKKILLACGVESLNEMAIEGLKPKGFEIIIVRNSKSIIEKIKGGKFDALVIDVQMEAISVKEVTSALKTLPKDTPRLILFSFFIRIDAAENSEKHYFYTHYLNDGFDGIKDVYYLGAFSRESSKDTFVKAVLSRLQLKAE